MDYCVTPNYGGMGDNKTQICELPEAKPPASGVVCSGFSDCNTCLSSENCAWAEGSTCQTACEVGKHCVTPNYGGMGDDKSKICSLSEATSPTPSDGISCGTYTNCQACLSAGYSFTPNGCAWSVGTTCTSTCPGGDASTCVTPNYGNAGRTFDEICALPAAQPPKSASKEDEATPETTSAESAGAGIASMTALVGAGIAAMAL